MCCDTWLRSWYFSAREIKWSREIKGRKHACGTLDVGPSGREVIYQRSRKNITPQCRPQPDPFPCLCRKSLPAAVCIGTKRGNRDHFELGLVYSLGWKSRLWEIFSVRFRYSVPNVDEIGSFTIGVEAANRALDTCLGWFADPIFKGDYPASMKAMLCDRLPRFSAEDVGVVKGSSEFFGLNAYSASLCRK